LEHAPRDLLLVAILLLATSLAFGLGILAGRNMAGQGSAISLSQAPEGENAIGAAAAAPQSATTSDSVVASKNGTKYYPPDCSGASRISVANKISFASPAAAIAAGYSLAANCKGD
jgi:hypothetical protein